MENSAFTAEQIKELKAPLDRSHVKERKQGGRNVSYIEGWHAIAEANRIFGFDGWTRELLNLKQLGEPYPNSKGNWTVAYMATVRVTVRPSNQLDIAWAVTRDGSGYGSGIDLDLASAHEKAIKEAETDAMKRAFMTFGNAFGLALYDKEQREVADAPPPPSEQLSMAREAMRRNTTREALGSWFNGQKADLRETMDLDDYATLLADVQAYRDTLPEIKAAA